MTLINLARYPIETDTQQRAAAVTRVRAELEEDGCAVLKQFLTPSGVAALTTEAEMAAPEAHRSFSRTNAYFTQDNPDLPEHHPARRFFERSNAFVPADRFATDGPLRRIYDHPGFDGFIRDCLDQPEECFFRYADPLADVIVNMAEEGNGFP